MAPWLSGPRMKLTTQLLLWKETFYMLLFIGFVCVFTARISFVFFFASIRETPLDVQGKWKCG